MICIVQDERASDIVERVPRRKNSKYKRRKYRINKTHDFNALKADSNLLLPKKRSGIKEPEPLKSDFLRNSKDRQPNAVKIENIDAILYGAPDYEYESYLKLEYII